MIQNVRGCIGATEVKVTLTAGTTCTESQRHFSLMLKGRLLFVVLCIYIRQLELINVNISDFCTPTIFFAMLHKVSSQVKGLIVKVNIAPFFSRV
jgi:hypothetical protein